MMTRLSRSSWFRFGARVLVAVGLATPLVVSGAAPLQPFVLPWNDVSAGVTDLRPWQPAAAGAQGWVAVTEDGHYTLAGERIRFLGVNIGAGAAFPTAARADVHAARLARFGINSVRLHHLEAPWEPAGVLIDYPSGSSRQLSAARLDRLHYFVAALAREGIYTNLNLLVSREFQATDGLGPEITQLGWKDQHVLGFFDATALALHQEYATSLLSAPNPHRGGLPLAQDPAVAFVEIMNENGLVQKWYENVLDGLPAVYRATLQARWNAWLSEHYADTAALLAAWGAIDQPLGANQLTNGTFASGVAGWNAERHETAVASFTGTSDFTGGGPALRINVTIAGPANWNVQLNQSPLSLVAGQVYTVSFWARSNVAVPFSAGIQKAYPDWSTLAPGLGGNFSPTWTQYQWIFQAGVSDTNARLNFGGFGDRVCTVWLADVRFSPGGQIGGLPAGVTLEAGTVPPVTRTPGALAATSAQHHDWLAFLADCERDYWTAMYQHVKVTLGYTGIVWGTIIANSPPNAQAVFDATDSHAYWQHPQFPAGQEWDLEAWTVNNVSMVNEANGGTLGGLARQRVLGRPHNITEYQHASPNTYASEAPLLVAAYGALQDWDGIWMFDYTTVDAAGAGVMNGYFDQAQHPAKMANLLLAAAMFRRADVSRARKNYVLPLTPATEIDLMQTRGGAWSIADGAHLDVPASLALVSRVALAIGEDATGLDAPPAAPVGPVLVADTGELTWDNSRVTGGIVTVDTARTKAVVGFADGATFDLGGVVLAPGITRQGWCTLGITLQAGRAFDHAGGGSALVVATGDIENTGMGWKSAARNSVGSQWGTAPTLVEVVPATITLPVATNRVQGWVLDGNGQRVATLPVSDAGGRARVTLGGAGTTLWYEIAIAPVAETVAPVVTLQPMSLAVAAGSPAVLSAEVDGWPTPALQWYRNGQPVPGATGPELVIAAAAAGDVGTYHVVAENAADSIPSRIVRFGLIPAGGVPAAEQLINVSTRGPTRVGPEVMIAGFVVQGTAPRQILIRGIGPTLADFGVSDVLLDPQLDLFRLGDVAAWQSNNDWDPVPIGNLFTTLGAFPLTDAREACLLLTLSPGSYTAHLSGVGGTTGTALVEIYDASHQQGRVLNLSTRGLAGQGGAGLIVGFVINGTAPKRVLIRGIGPALGGYGVANVVADPRLLLDRVEPGGAVPLRHNDDWEDTAGPAIAAAAAEAGAFPLPATSNDSALLLWLEPGVFTARMEAKGATGIGLVEVYELD